MKFSVDQAKAIQARAFLQKELFEVRVRVVVRAWTFSSLSLSLPHAGFSLTRSRALKKGWSMDCCLCAHSPFSPPSSPQEYTFFPDEDSVSEFKINLNVFLVCLCLCTKDRN